MPTAWLDDEDTDVEDGVWPTDDEDAEWATPLAVHAETVVAYAAAEPAVCALHLWKEGNIRWHVGWTRWGGPVPAVQDSPGVSLTGVRAAVLGVLEGVLSRPDRKLADVLAMLSVTLDELDAEPPPADADIAPVAQQLESSLARLQRLRFSLVEQPQDDSASDDDDKNGSYELVDWRALNHQQAQGWPKGMQDESGTPLRSYRPTSYGVPVIEVDEGSLFD